jgi:transposase
MSLRSPSAYRLPEQTARVARAAFPRGNPYLRMHDVLGAILTNPEFADLDPQEGQPAADPAWLALVTIFCIQDRLAERALLPGEHLVDACDVTAAHLIRCLGGHGR